MLIDLHCHSYLSQGCTLDPRAVLERAASHGLDAVCFTETNTQDGCDELFDIGRTSKVKVFVGLELNTDKGQYLCFFPKPEQAPEPVQMWGSNRERPWSAEEALPKVRQLGAAIVAARPYDRDYPYPALDYILGLKLLSGVEGYNPKLRQSQNDLAVEAAEKLNVGCVGGSDARGSLDEIGFGATLFEDDLNSNEDLVKALLNGRFWAVQMGELPRPSRPGEAREVEAKRGKKKRRRWRN
ncbi:MAG: PHP domain-containing protein [Myxococcaceae bacterium]|nr:PHP domain-containing protein [Myxococcaceae bacterium]